MKEENLEKEQENSIHVEEDMVPIKNPDVTIREEIEEDGKHILFNAENELILVINTSGKFILDSCNGEKTVGEIAATIENDFAVNKDIDLIEVVKDFPGQFAKRCCDRRHV